MYILFRPSKYDRVTPRSAKKNDQYKEVVQLADAFARQEGRRPRILIALSKNEAGNKHNEVSSSFADFGFDVDIAPRYGSVDSLSKQAIENDVHMLLIFAKKRSDIVLIDNIVKGLNSYRRRDILLAVKTNVVLEVDQDLKNSGHVFVFDASTKTNDLAICLLNTFFENK